ncbi:MAG: DUF6174 domain-containing protein [Fibrobacteria bacterium]
MSATCKTVLSLIALVTMVFCPRHVWADEYTDNLAKWNSMRPAFYQYEHSMSCYCQPERWLVQAKGRTVTSAVRLSVDFFPASNPFDTSKFSIDSLFGRIKTYQALNPYRLNVVYDPEFGYPRSIFIDGADMIADDELSIGVDMFKVIVPGLRLSADTVYGATMSAIPDERKSLRITNTGDSAFYLNSIELSVPNGYTFANVGIALRIDISVTPSATQNAPIFLRSGRFAFDTVQALANAMVPPGGEVSLRNIATDPCFCLVKTGAEIRDGDSVTLTLRLNFSRSVSDTRKDMRLYAYVKAKYGSTSSIRGRTRAGRHPTAEPGTARGFFRIGNRSYTLDGSVVRLHRAD